MTKSDLVDVTSLYKQCSYPIYLETDKLKPSHERIANRGGYAVSDNCNAPADTVVVVDKGKDGKVYDYRCPAHRGKVTPDKTGEVLYKIKNIKS